MTRHTEDTPAAVPLAQQAGTAERHPLWMTATPCVRTARMLTTLIEGVEGGKWFRLIDKVFSERNLLTAFQQVARSDGASGVDHVSVEEFGQQIPENLWQLSDALKTDTYRPQATRRVHTPKPGTTETRPLGIPSVRDRVVEAATVNMIEPIFERDFAEHSYGFRPSSGCKDTLRRVDHLLAQLRLKISDGRVLSLIESFLTTGIIDGAAEWTPESGAPQSAVLSPLLSNVYLDSLDHLVADSGFEMVPYAHDLWCCVAREKQPMRPCPL